MNGEGKLLPTLTFLLVMRGMQAIDPSQELHPVSFSRMTMITTMSVGAGARLAKAWETMPNF